MPDISFSEDAWADYLELISLDKALAKRVNALLKDALRSPYEGLGKPEPLKYGLDGFWSRRISDKDRLVYEVKDGAIRVIQCRGHYEDK